MSEDFGVMNKQLTINVSGKPRIFFFQTGFYRHHKYKNLDFHLHSYAEIHIFLNCTAKFITPSDTYELVEGDVLLVPKDVFHAYKMSDGEGSLHCTFQLDIPIDKIKIKKFPVSYLSSFLAEAERLDENDYSADHSKVALYLSFICGHFIEREKCHPRPVRDYAFIIREFISQSYASNITLTQLADALCVSKKQAERLAVKYTGKTFLEELTNTRMNAAEQYMTMYENIPLTKIATLVGYQSYSGFYKAYRRYKSQKTQN